MNKARTLILKAKAYRIAADMEANPEMKYILLKLENNALNEAKKRLKKKLYKKNT